MAIGAYRELLAFDSGAIDAHSLLGDLYFQKQDYPQAIHEFKAAFNADSENPQARNNLISVYHKYGQVLDRQQRYDQAITQLEKGLALAPAAHQPSLEHRVCPRSCKRFRQCEGGV